MTLPAQLKPLLAFLAIVVPFVGSANPAQADTLDEACWQAVATDQSIRSRQMETRAARWEYRAAKGGRLPQVKAMSEYVLLSDRPGINVDMAPFGTLNTPVLNKDFNVTTASLTQPIWAGGQVKWAVNAAASKVSAAERSVMTAVQDVKLAAATGYVTVLRAQRLLAVAEANVVSLRSHVKDVSNMLDQGMVAKNDYLAAEVALANSVQARRRAINGLDTARASYNRQVGRPLDTPVSLDEIDLPAASEDLDALTYRAMQCRSELATLAAQANTLRSQAKQSQAENMPTVACGGTYAHVQKRHHSAERYLARPLRAQLGAPTTGASRDRKRMPTSNRRNRSCGPVRTRRPRSRCRFVRRGLTNRKLATGFR